MTYNFDEIIDRAGTHTARLDLLPEGTPSDVLSLWIADMDFTCPEPVLQALHRRIDKKILGYTIYDNDRVKDAVRSWFQGRYGWSIEKAWMFFSPGIVPAYSFMMNFLTREGDGVIIQKPVYYPFADKILANKRSIANNSLVRQGNRYVMNFKDLEEKFADPKNKGIILCNPHNPVGRVWTEEELRNVVSIAKKYDKWIISDEIHGDLTRLGITYTPLLKAAGEYRDRIMVCTAPSKTFNLAGLQFSNIIIPNPGYQNKWTELTNSRTSLTFGSNPLSLEAAVAAYTEGADWLDQARAYIDSNIAYVAEFIKENLPKASLLDCEGTFLVWIDLSGYCADPKKLEHAMLYDAKLALDEGYIFGEEGIGYERVNIAIPRSTLVTCMERMKKALLAL